MPTITSDFIRQTIWEEEVKADKELRRDLDIQLQKLKQLPISEQRQIAVERLTEAIMWLGMDLKRFGTQSPYPEGKNPDNTIIEPTADGLKM